MDRISSIFARFEPSQSSHSLTSNVIGHVMPRASIGRGAVFHEVGSHSNTPYDKTQLQTMHMPSVTTPLPATPRSPEIARLTSVAPHQAPVTCLKETSSTQMMCNGAVRSSDDLQKPREVLEQDFKNTTSLSTRLPPKVTTAVRSVKNTQATDPGNPKPKRKRIRLKTPRRREQCRANQARYRRKQKEHSNDLEIAVAQLRHEVPMLEKQYNRLVSGVKLSVWYVVMQYFHIFRNGVRPSGQTASGPEAWLQNSEAQQQLSFLQSSISDNVLVGEQRGIDALLEQLKRYTRYFDDLQVQMEHVTRVSKDFIAATASLNVTISEFTLEQVFPHLVPSDGDHHTAQGDKAAILRSKLLGQRLFLPFRLSFHWDEQSERVVQMECAVDLVTPLLKIVDTLADVAFVLERARVSQSGALGVI
ncbi:unnamed protein product [Phytophthora fragariaefolia]|uniref:Unnamed protein product n=1 Tax=Phytophthora fragariaefolia TaxID=1490495 RepID=A0A9W6XTD2_9STRA|nr:unnamed protein product [Phytophthora fragariaefolia]